MPSSRSITPVPVLGVLLVALCHSILPEISVFARDLAEATALHSIDLSDSVATLVSQWWRGSSALALVVGVFVLREHAGD